MAKLLEEFPPVATADWEALIRADLKGADYDKKLIWRTDGLAFRPYYRAEDLAGLEHLDGIRAGRVANEWEIADVLPEVNVDAARFEDAGATVVQELGYALAEGIEYLADKSPAEIRFSMAIGSSYFLQIAKLRALRLLWARVLEAFGRKDVKTIVCCRTSRWNKSIYDPHVNILRATTEAMAAAIGGADVIAVDPFDQTYKEPDTASRRLARNTQLLLKHEAWLDKVADPAAGSYYIEKLTDSVAVEAWKLMQQIDEFGGFKKAHDTGMIPAAIAESRAKKEAAIEERRKIFVGVNQYPNLNEKVLGKLEPHAGGIEQRGPEVFESIRLRTEQSGSTPRFLLAEFGDLKMRKARSQFIANFFGCGGFAIETRYFSNLAEAAEVQADAIVLCSSDAEYTAGAETLAAALKAAGKTTPLIVAGYPKDSIEALKQSGVTEFVHIKSNAAKTLAAWQERLA